MAKARSAGPGVPAAPKRPALAMHGQLLLCMPFEDEHSDGLLETLKGYCRAIGLDLQRADGIPTGTDIFKNVRAAMANADAVIVDVTGGKRT